MTTETDYFNNLCTVSRALAKNLKKQKIFDRIVSTATGTLNGKGACLFLKNREQAGLSFRGAKTAYLRNIWQPPQKTPAD
ncbi:MAG: hypothetical protein R2874_05235 [Desulfobacterales bacterium]